VREITLRIKSDRLAENVIGLVRKIKGIEIFEPTTRKQTHKRSKIQQILDEPYDVENFRIYKREEIYEEAGIHR
jgi:hypothetical protein